MSVLVETVKKTFVTDQELAIDVLPPSCSAL